MIIGEKVEEKYRSFFSRECPRPIKIRNQDSGDGLFRDCLLEQWQPLIQDVLKELLVDPPKLNQLIKGRTGSRSFDQAKADELLTIIETSVKNHLRKTEEGVQFYREGKNTTVKALTFCILGCQLIRMAKEKWNLSGIKAKLINKTLVHYYLEGAATISNAELNDFEGFIVAREKNKDKQSLPIIPKVKPIEEKEEDNDEDDFSVTSPLLLPRDKLKNLGIVDVDDYFLEGDQDLTDAFQKICTDEEVENKRCITCDETHEFYSVASRKLIHLFIYKNDLFQNIDFAAECLLEEQIDVNELRRRVELMLRQEVGQWELTQKEKNKFVLCTICHLIRHLKFLGQLDLVDGVQTFFKFRGQIFNLSQVELGSERTQVMNELRLDKPKIVGKEEPKEIVVTQLPKQETISKFNMSDKEKIEFAKKQFELLANEFDMNSLTPIEIIDYKIKAKELLNPEEVEENPEPDHSWVDVFIAHMKDKELLPFLAKEALIRLVKEEKKENANQNKNTSLISDEQLELNKQQCSKCRETIDFAVCLERMEEVTKAISKGNKTTKKLWTEREDLRPCIANKLSEK